MSLNSQLYLIPYFLSALISLSIGIYAVRCKSTAGAIPFAIAVFSQTFWTIGYIFELATPTLAGKIFWDNIQWIGSLIWPVAFLYFVLRFTGSRFKYNVGVWTLISAPLLIILTLVFTNDFHELVRQNDRLIPGDPFSELKYDFGIIIWVAALYSYALFFYSIYKLIKYYFQSQQLFRNQIIILILGTFIPFIGTIYTMLDIPLTFHRDIAPMTFALSDLVIMWGLFRFRLLNVIPIARDRLVESMHDAVIVLDNQNRLVDVNPSALQLIGKESKVIIGSPMDEVFKTWEGFINNIQDKTEVNEEIKLNLLNQPSFFDLRLSPLYDKSGNLIGKLIALRNISKRKRAEKALHKINNELEDRINERTKEITQANTNLINEIDKRKETEKKLLASMQKAEAANIAKSQFLSNMSHELRTPIHHILGFAQIGRSKIGKVSQEKIITYFQSVSSSAEKLLTLLNNLLDLASIETGKIELLIKKSNLNEIVDSCIAELWPMLSKKEIKLVNETPERSTKLLCDVERIFQVVLNLLQNAIQYTPVKKRISITYRFNQEAINPVISLNTQSIILFQISDEGVGIPEGELQVIFERFVLSSKTNTGAGGTGVGLPICKNVIEAHGGKIWAENNPEGGANFCFTLPLGQ
jgi:PAS domain S-box-containing protein